MSVNTTFFTGVWRNEATGTLILTLTQRDAGVLTSAITIFLGFVASQFWQAVQFIAHQVSVDPRQDDCLYHQKLVSLRNKGSAPALLMAVCKLRSARTWGSKGRWAKSWGKISGLVALSLLYFLATEATRLSASLIWSASDDQVLARGSHCGFLTLPNATDPVLKDLYRTFILNQTLTAETYVRQCNVANPDPLRCGYYPAVSIPWQGSSVACPFASPEVCITNNSMPYQMDTGLVDSDTMLGMNARPSDRISIRKVTTCSPIDGLIFLDTVDSSQTDEASQLHNSSLVDRFYLGSFDDSNPITYEYPHLASKLNFPYDLTWALASRGDIARLISFSGVFHTIRATMARIGLRIPPLAIAQTPT